MQLLVTVICYFLSSHKFVDRCNQKSFLKDISHINNITFEEKDTFDKLQIYFYNNKQRSLGSVIVGRINLSEKPETPDDC